MAEAGKLKKWVRVVCGLMPLLLVKLTRHSESFPFAKLIYSLPSSVYSTIQLCAHSVKNEYCVQFETSIYAWSYVTCHFS